MKLDAKVPAGPIAEKWDRHKFQMKLVNPANKRKYHVVVVGSGLAGASAAATLGDNPDQKQWAQFKLAPEFWRDGIFIAPHGVSFDKKGNLIVQDWNFAGRVTMLRRAPSCCCCRRRFSCRASHTTATRCGTRSRSRNICMNYIPMQACIPPIGSPAPIAGRCRVKCIRAL